MYKRGKSIICSFEIFLLILSSFAISFIMQENLVLAQEGVISYKEASKVSTGAINPIQTNSIKQVQQILTYPQPQSYEVGGQTFSEIVKRGDTFYAKTSANEIKLEQAQLDQLRAAGANLETPIGGYNYKVPFLGYETTNFFYGNLLEGFVWSIAVIGVIQIVGRLAGADEGLVNTLSISAAAAIIGGKAVYGLFGTGTGQLGSGGIFSQYLSPFASGLIGVGIGVVIFEWLDGLKRT